MADACEALMLDESATHRREALQMLWTECLYEPVKTLAKARAPSRRSEAAAFEAKRRAWLEAAIGAGVEQLSRLTERDEFAGALRFSIL